MEYGWAKVSGAVLPKRAKARVKPARARRVIVIMGVFLSSTCTSVRMGKLTFWFLSF
jgi:hypothetical protein